MELPHIELTHAEGERTITVGNDLAS